MLSETKNSVSIQKLEYIQSTGTQRIDTGYIPKVNTVLEMDIQFVKNKYTNAPNLILSVENNFFGVSEQVDSFTANFGGATSQFAEIYYWNNIRGGEIRSCNYGDVTKRSVFTLNNNSSVFQGIRRELTPKSGDNTESMILFGRKMSYDGAPAQEACLKRYDMKLYSCKIYEDETLIKDFIPAMYREKVGLYDQVEKKFYENIGTGEFLYSDYELYPVDSQNRFLIKKIDVKAGDEVTINYYATSEYGYLYDGRNVGLGYANNKWPGAKQDHIIVSNKDMTVELKIPSDGQLVVGGFYKDADGQLSASDLDVFKGRYIKIKIVRS